MDLLVRLSEIELSFLVKERVLCSDLEFFRFFGMESQLDLIALDAIMRSVFAP